MTEAGRRIIESARAALTEIEKQDLLVANWIIEYMMGWTNIGRVIGNVRQNHNEEWREMMCGLGRAARGVQDR